jgi:hypothetical protein
VPLRSNFDKLFCKVGIRIRRLKKLKFISACRQQHSVRVFHPRREEFDSPVGRGHEGRQGVPTAQQDAHQVRQITFFEIQNEFGGNICCQMNYITMRREHFWKMLPV